MGLRPDTLHEVRGEVSQHERQREGDRDSALPDQVDRIYHLGVTQTQAAHPAALDPEVNPSKPGDADDAAAAPELAGEVDVLLPAVEHEALVEAKIPDRAHPDRHVAAVCSDVIDNGRSVPPIRRGQ